MSDMSMGKRFGKPDIERIGLFSEMGYMNGKGYVPLFGKPNYMKGPNFLNSGRKTKNGTQHGYFEDDFKRLFIGEGIIRKTTKGKPKQQLTPFIVNSVPKKHSTPGDTYGTFTPHTEAFSPKQDVPKYVHEPANFLWRCGKIGGPGYADSGINKYPEHLADRYGLKLQVKQYGSIMSGPFLNAIFPKPFFEKKSPFTEDPLPTVGLHLDRYKRKKDEDFITWIPTGPAKSQGGSHAGCFEKFTEFMPCKYVTMTEANKPRGSGKLDSAPFVPIPLMPKTQQTNSILNQSVDIFMNSQNAQSYVPCYIERLLSDMYS